MTLNPIEEQNKTIRCLQDQIERLEAKVQRIQDARLSKFAGLAMQGYCTLGANTNHEEARRMTDLAVFQAKALIAALNDEQEQPDE